MAEAPDQLTLGRHRDLERREGRPVDVIAVEDGRPLERLRRGVLETSGNISFIEKS